MTSKIVRTRAAIDVLDERERQCTSEGWTLQHDDEHQQGTLALAAAAYAAWQYRPDEAEAIFPFDDEWLKTTTPRRDLVKAGALILAEIERLDRRYAAPVPKKPTAADADDLCARLRDMAQKVDQQAGYDTLSGGLYNQAADRIAELRKERDRLREELWTARNELSDIINTWSGKGIAALDERLYVALEKVDSALLAILFRRPIQQR